MNATCVFTLHGGSQLQDGRYQIKSKLLVLGAVNTIINDLGCQNVTGRFESIRKLLNKPAGWPKFVQSHPTVKTIE